MAPSSSSSPPPIEFVVFDLDGLVLDTETLCAQVAAEVLSKRGKQLTADVLRNATGRRPLEAWQLTAEAVGLPRSCGADLYAESEPLLSARWGEAKPMPGALRLLRHLEALAVPLAVATSTPRVSFQRKLEGKPELRRLLTRCGGAVACGDEVKRGKPAPDVFELAVAKLLRWQEGQGGGGGAAAGAAASGGFDSGAEAWLPRAREVLRAGRVAVFEDAPSGVEGALAAGARVILVPSLRDAAAYPSAPACDCGGGGDVEEEKGTCVTTGCLAAQVPSLLAFDPRSLGLPAFDDLVPSSRPLSFGGGRGAVPLDPPLRIRGRVVRGFGRGSRELGIPTANVDPDALVTSLAEAVTGVYVGWACVVTPAAAAKNEGGAVASAAKPRLAVAGGEVALGEGDNGNDTSAAGRAPLPSPPPGVYPTALSIGYNPQFGHSDRRTCEPWVLADYGDGTEFYGESIRLVITGFLRPEAAFVSVEKLIETIHGDARDAKRALADPRFLRHAHDAFLTSVEAGEDGEGGGKEEKEAGVEGAA
jgi:riboflavin kinase / FMN hydrolase